MQALDVLEAGASAAGKVGAALGRLVAKVNPDVWRELAYVSLSAYSLAMPRKEKVLPGRPDGFAPVVLVHGLGGNRGAWLPLRLFLRMNGHRRVYAFSYAAGTIEGHAEALAVFVDSVLEATGERQADIVAHSMGAIISRYAIQRLGLRDKVRTLVTLAAMHQGTYAAHYANTPLTRSLRPESPLIQDLNRDDPECYPRRFFSICTDCDVYVVPAESMRHPFAENIYLPRISHAQHLVSPKVFRVVSSFLEPCENSGAIETGSRAGTLQDKPTPTSGGMPCCPTSRD
ncbi:MAG: alpha/beta fold hydrolase [bacterium]